MKDPTVHKETEAILDAVRAEAVNTHDAVTWIIPFMAKHSLQSHDQHYSCSYACM